MQTGTGFIEKRVKTFGTAEAELERDRAEITEHQLSRPVHALDPISQLASIGDCGRQRHQLHRWRAVNDRFLPDGSTLGIIHVMALIEDYRLHVSQGVISLVRFRIEHVAKNLGGHHDHLGLPVDAQVPGHQTNVIGSELLAEIPQLLVGQRLQWRGVEHLLAMGNGSVDGVFTHQGLARPRRRTDHNRMALIEGIDGLELKIIQREGEHLLEVDDPIGGSLRSR